MKPNYDYTKKQASKDVWVSIMLSCIATGIVSFAIHCAYKPTDRYWDGYDDGVNAMKKLAAEQGRAEYRLNKQTGKIKWTWK